jgi:hypothetical protein
MSFVKSDNYQKSIFVKATTVTTGFDDGDLTLIYSE